MPLIENDPVLSRRLTFVYMQTAAMLAIILVLSFSNELTLTRWYFLSWISLAVLSVVFRIWILPTQFRQRIYVVVAVTGIGTAVIVGRAIIAFLDIA